MWELNPWDKLENPNPRSFRPYLTLMNQAANNFTKPTTTTIGIIPHNPNLRFHSHKIHQSHLAILIFV
jgi:hypothetical protein